MNLLKKSELANNILENETSYFKDKNIIYGFFTNSKDKLSKEIIESQLTVISFDSLIQQTCQEDIMVLKRLLSLF